MEVGSPMEAGVSIWRLGGRSGVPMEAGVSIWRLGGRSGVPMEAGVSIWRLGAPMEARCPYGGLWR